MSPLKPTPPDGSSPRAIPGASGLSRQGARLCVLTQGARQYFILRNMARRGGFAYFKPKEGA